MDNVKKENVQLRDQFRAHMSNCVSPDNPTDVHSATSHPAGTVLTAANAQTVTDDQTEADSASEGDDEDSDEYEAPTHYRKSVSWKRRSGI